MWRRQNGEWTRGRGHSIIFRDLRDCRETEVDEGMMGIPTPWADTDMSHLGQYDCRACADISHIYQHDGRLR